MFSDETQRRVMERLLTLGKAEDKKRHKSEERNAKISGQQMDFYHKRNKEELRKWFSGADGDR